MTSKKWNILWQKFKRSWTSLCRLKAWVSREVWKTAQWSCSARRWPALHHRILKDTSSGERRGIMAHHVAVFHQSSKHFCFSWKMNVSSRLWCLWSTVGRVPKTSRTHRCCRTSQRPPTSACASCAPAPCWLTWYPRRRETPLSHAGWGLVTSSQPLATNSGCGGAAKIGLQVLIMVDLRRISH